MPYARLWACAPRTARPVLGVAALAWLAALLLVMATVCNTFLVPAVEWAAAAARIPPPLAGVTLLAVAAGAPDLATEVAAVLAGDSAGPVDGGLAAAVAVGSSLAALCGGVAVTALASRARGGATLPSPAAAARDGGAYAVAAAALAACLRDGELSLADAGALLALYAAYIATAVALGRTGGALAGGGDSGDGGGARGGGDGPAAPVSAFARAAAAAAASIELAAVAGGASPARRRGTGSGAGEGKPVSPPLAAAPPTPRAAPLPAPPRAPHASISIAAATSSTEASDGSAGSGGALLPGGGKAAPLPARASRRDRLAARFAADLAPLLPKFVHMRPPWVRALARVAAAPGSVALHATTPSLAADPPVLGVAHASLLAAAAPGFALTFLGAGPPAVRWPVFGGAWVAATAALAAALAPRFAASRGRPASMRTPLLAALALAGAGAWLSAAADEAVALLRAAAAAASLPEELAGGALLSWGGAFPELVAAATLARAGPRGATAALHSAAAGPVFNLLVALPIPAALAAVRSRRAGGKGAPGLALTLTNGVVSLLLSTAAVLLVLAVALPLARWRVTARSACALLALYGVTQIAFIACESGVWGRKAVAVAGGGRGAG